MEFTLDQALQKGIEAHTAGKAQEAEQYYTAILKAKPKHPDANHNMGVLAVGAGKVEEALPFFKTALEINPNIEQFWLSYLDALIRLDRINDAKKIFDQAKSKGLSGDAFDQIEKQLGFPIPKASNHQEPPTEELNTLINLYKQNRLHQVFNEGQKLTKLYTKSLTLWNLIGASAVQLGQLDDAVSAFQKAINIKPDYVEAHYNMGISLQEQGKLHEALEAYNQALDIKPDYVEAHYNVGNALKGQGKPEEAVEAYNKALSLKPDYAEAHNNLGLALNEQSKLDEAIVAYTKALSIKPDYADSYYNMGNTLKEQGKLEEAIEAYKKALPIRPDYAEAYNNMGAVLKEQGKVNEAIEAYTKAITIKPDYAEAHNNIGNAFKDKGKSEEAIEAYNKAISLKPDYAEATTNLAVLLFEIGRFEEAAKLFAMNDSIKNQSYLLKCFYELDKKSKFFDQLDYLIRRGANNCVIGSYVSRSAIRYGINRENPFCNEPFKYVEKIDLTKKCDFKKIFVENAASVLSSGEVSHKAQGLLKNGIQTSGNIFMQAGYVTNLWRNIIQSELENYKNNFFKSEEGLIQNWPSDYSLYGWLISMKNGGELSAHIHDTGWITGSIYINVPPKLKQDSGNLVVTTHDPKFGKGNSKDIKSINVVTGSLCFFPSSLLHYTIPFESDEDRIVLAFDVIPNK